MFSDNEKKLIKAGWKEGISGESIISIESDFSAWNSFTVEHGVPTKFEKRLLAAEYKKCAGNVRALISHVKRLGKIDDALTNLLTAPALKQYEEVTAPARKQYEEVTAPAWKQYKEVTAPALKQYKEVTATALKQYEEVTATAWIKLFSVKTNRVPHLQ